MAISLSSDVRFYKYETEKVSGEQRNNGKRTSLTSKQYRDFRKSSKNELQLSC